MIMLAFNFRYLCDQAFDINCNVPFKCTVREQCFLIRAATIRCVLLLTNSMGTANSKNNTG